jgi:hypothetical protein
LDAFAANRLAAALFATFVDFLDVLPAIVFSMTNDCGVNSAVDAGRLDGYFSVTCFHLHRNGIRR